MRPQKKSPFQYFIQANRGTRYRLICILSAFAALIAVGIGMNKAAASILNVTEAAIPTGSEYPPPTEDSADGSKRVFLVYISGIDNRGGLIDESLSDVNILAAINRDTRELLLISIPRDYYVIRADSGRPDKLTHVGMAGITALQQTVSDLIGEPIDYYFRLNFGGFIDIINAIGGVEVESEYAFDAAGFHFVEGSNYVDGEAALAFCRERYAFPDGDRQRGRNQIALIKALVRKLTAADSLRHSGALIEAAEGSFETDMPYELIFSLVREQLSDPAPWEMNACNLAGEDGSDFCDWLGQTAYVMYPDTQSLAEAQQLLQAHASGIGGS